MVISPERLETAHDLLDVAGNVAVDSGSLDVEGVVEFLERRGDAQRVADALLVARSVPIELADDSRWAGMDHESLWRWIASTTPAFERDMPPMPEPVDLAAFHRRALAVIVLAFAMIERETGVRPGAQP